MQPGVNSHRHTEHQRDEGRRETQFQRRRHLFEDNLTNRSRLLVGETEIPLCGVADKPGELHDKTVVEP